MRLFALAFAVVVAACASPTTSGTAVELEEIDVAGFEQLLATSEQPLVVNLWASWCIPCRSEAPLLREAHARFGDQVRFIGIASEDSPSGSRDFLAEFGLEFENYADPAAAVRGYVGAIGLPVTLFVEPGGTILRTHYGVIDDAALALGIDDLVSG
ncbi:MAG: TlpA disulfide reductase family protein [Acidimicrobiia bacterium]|nr:TlpA disulfide reductase family protein [Acidimicrobiia bacterium]